MDRSMTSVGLLLLLITSAACAQDDALRQGSANSPPVSSALAFNLHDLIADVADEIGKEIIVDPRLPPAMRAGFKTGDIDGYETLLAVLRLNGFAAIEKPNQVLIVPAQDIRADATRILNQDDPRVSDHEIVTRVINLPGPGDNQRQSGRATSDAVAAAPESGIIAAQLIPILRPLLPTNAMLGAVPNSNTLIVVDRYDNVRRISMIIQDILAGMQD